MEPRERPSDLLSGAECAACGRAVPEDRVRVLASRDDLAFAELPCEPCGSVSLAIFGGPVTQPPDPAPPPLSSDDVLDMHRFLAGWSGDLRSLVGRSTRSRRGSEGS